MIPLLSFCSTARDSATPHAPPLALSSLRPAMCHTHQPLPPPASLLLSLSHDQSSHPGAVLKMLARALKMMIEDGRRRGLKRGQRWGVIWDYASLHQPSPKVIDSVRTAEEEVLFTRGLNAYGALYSHPHITVLEVTRMPSGYPEGYGLGANAKVATYWDRGWPTAEHAWATLIKRNIDLVLDLGQLTGREIDRTDLLKVCAKPEAREPPLHLIPQRAQRLGRGACAQRAVDARAQRRQLLVDALEHLRARRLGGERS